MIWWGWLITAFLLGVAIGILIGYWRIWTGLWVAYGLRHYYWFYATGRKRAERKAQSLFYDWEKPLEIHSLLDLLNEQRRTGR